MINYNYTSLVAPVAALFVTGCVTHVPEGGRTNAQYSTSATTVKSGKPKTMAASEMTNFDCAPAALPEFKVTTRPEHGKFWVADGMIKGSFQAGDPRTKCNGRPIRVVGLWYQSATGYVGPDFMAWTIGGGRKPAYGSIKITVVK